jgi:hypothetical protein
MPAVAFAYHDIGPRRRGDRYTVEPALFERQVDSLQRGRAAVVERERDTHSRRDYSERVGRSAVAAGYRTLFVSDPWTEPRSVDGALLLGRFGVVADTPPAWVAAIARLERTAILRAQASWRARKLVQRGLGPVYLSLRRSALARRHA